MVSPDGGGFLQIRADLQIPASELSFTSSRSSGPGGQNVNKVATRVTLFFDVDSSPSLTPAQKARLHDRLGTRISRAGVLQLSSQEHRSQSRNREAAVDRFVEVLRGALRRQRVRRPTRQPRRAKEKRLQQKKWRSRIKEGRAGIRREDV